MNTPTTYTLQLSGKTITGGVVTGSLTLTVTQASPTLALGALAQDGPAVTMTVAWPADLQVSGRLTH